MKAMGRIKQVFACITPMCPAGEWQCIDIANQDLARGLTPGDGSHRSMMIWRGSFEVFAQPCWDEGRHRFGWRTKRQCFGVEA